MTQRKRHIGRVLIANRGEIARRIIRSCHRIGIETVAVYTDADTHAPFVHEATRSEPLGDPRNYLSIPAILDALTRSKADAVHPGYGFLSENPDFAEAVSSAGAIFIGPPASTIRALGSKTNAKEIAKKANVPTSPTLLVGATSITEQVAAIRSFGEQIGFPLIVKAAAGGGGRGMRVLHADSDIAESLSSASREAEKSFGSAEVFVERYISPARHIEVQIAGDLDGRVVALGTRDCSLQRGNQKIIEEAPALNLQPGVLEELLAAACRLGKEAHYSNLGTVEFLYSPEGLFYFLEVNTRLQVEHPVTEMVTGLDLVELQIRLAEGDSLDSRGLSATPTPRGHAIEARVCAEEYTGVFVSRTGIISELDVPIAAGEESIVRADMGVEICSEVSHHYDSLLGKIIVHAPARLPAIGLLSNVLARTRISGVGTNRALLIHLLTSTDFKDLAHSVQGTSTLLPSPREIDDASYRAHAIAAALRAATPLSSWASLSPWMSDSARSVSQADYPFSSRGFTQVISSRTVQHDGLWSVRIEHPSPSTVNVRIHEYERLGSHSLQAVISLDGGPECEVRTLRDGAGEWVHLPDGTYAVPEVRERHGSGAGVGALRGASITSAIPGKIAAIAVSEGQSVTAGTTIMIIDSMKMEHPIRALHGGTVISIPVATGSVIQAGSVLAVIQPDDT